MVAWLDRVGQIVLDALARVFAYLRAHWHAVFVVAGVIALALVGWAAYLRWGLGRGWADWTGFGIFTGSVDKDNRGKMLWDWMELLIIPIVLALGAFWLQRSEKDSERKLAEQRRQDDQEKAKDQQWETALQTYFDKMTDLLLDEKHPLRGSAEEDEARVVARTRTLVTLQRLDPTRKGILIRFLFEAKLITPISSKTDAEGEKEAGGLSVINLSGANLSGANLEWAILHGANLQWANLRTANLRGATLNKADLSWTRQDGANLTAAALCEADLRAARLDGADLTGAYLSGAYLNGANLSSANLNWANLNGADLRGAVLLGADLSAAKLCAADLRKANLLGANLRKADLSGANLALVEVSTDQLSSVKALDYAIMPDGQKFDPTIHTFWKGPPADTSEQNGEGQ